MSWQYRNISERDENNVEKTENKNLIMQLFSENYGTRNFQNTKLTENCKNSTEKKVNEQPHNSKNVGCPYGPIGQPRVNITEATSPKETKSSVEEMKQLARTLINTKTMKERQDMFKEVLDYLSFEFSDCYSVFVRGVKKRENENNNPLLISKWQYISSESSIIKPREEMLQRQTDNIVCMLNQMTKQYIDTIETQKICDMINRIKLLTSVYKRMRMKFNNQMVYRKYQLRTKEKENFIKSFWNDNNNDFGQLTQSRYISNHDTYGRMEMHKYQNYQLGTKEKVDSIKSLWNDDNNDFEQLNIPHSQRQNIPVWPTALYSYNYTSQYKLNQFSNSECITITTFNNGHTDVSDFLQVFSKQTIVNQLMVEPVMLWLIAKELDDHKCFFMELSLNEIEEINEDNIENFISKINKYIMTDAEKKKICSETKLLRDRKPKCKKLILFLDKEVTLNELREYIIYVQNLLFCPIPNKNCMGNNGQLQQDIMLIMKKSLYQLYDKISARRKDFINSPLAMSIVYKYLKCASLISRNLSFTNDQVENTIIFAEMLKNKVYGNMGINQELSGLCIELFGFYIGFYMPYIWKYFHKLDQNVLSVGNRTL